MILASAAIQAASGTAIQTASSSSINTGIWSLFGVIVVAISTVLVAYIKQWGPWKNTCSAAVAADFARLRDEIERQNLRIEKLETLADRASKAAEEATRHSMRADAKLDAALSACEVLLSLVEREMPEAREIALAKRLLSLAAADDGGIGSAMRKLASIKGVPEQ